jgi:hypothetical protein
MSQERGSFLSLAIGTWMGRRSFVTGRINIGSNSPEDSPSDMPSGNITKQLICQVLSKQWLFQQLAQSFAAR